MAIIKEVLFNDGEGVVQDDFNNAQRFSRAFLTDMILGQLGRSNDGNADGFDTDVFARTLYLHTLGSQCAPRRDGAVNLRVSPNAGLILQVASNTINGDDSNVLAYWATAAELQTTHTAGDATNPRWDLVSVTLAAASGDAESRDFKDAITGALSSSSVSKRRRTTLTKTLTAGTPAGSPTIPATPAGAVPLYAVYVPATTTGLLSQSNIFDYRMPLGTFTVDMYGTEAVDRGAYFGTWTKIAGGAFGAVDPNAAGDELFFSPWSALRANHARLLSVQMFNGEVSGLSTFQLYRVTGNGYGQISGAVAMKNLTTTLITGGTAAGHVDYAYDLGGDQYGLIQGRNGPLWINGYGSPRNAFDVTGTDSLTRIAGRFVAGGGSDRVTMVRYTFAGSPF